MRHFAKRAVAFVVVAILVMSVFPAVSLATDVKTKWLKDYDSSYYVLANWKNDYLYNQFDKKYTKIFGDVGCPAVSEAMACSVTWGEKITPDNSKYIGWSNGQAETFTCDKRYPHSTETEELKKIADLVRKGYGVIVRANWHHSVCAIGLKKSTNLDSVRASDILVADPNKGRIKKLSDVRGENGYPGSSGSYYGWSLLVTKNKGPVLKSDVSTTTPSGPIADTTISFSGIKAPNGGTLEYGKGYHLAGKVTAKGGKIAKIEAKVIDRDGKQFMKKSVTVNKSSYTLNDSSLDWALAFGSLPAGQYKLTYTATPDKGKAVTTSKSFTVVLPVKWYTLSPKNASKLCLDVQGGKTTNGTNVQVYTANKTYSQQWKLKHVGNGWYTLTARNSNKVLDVKGGNTASGTNVQQYESNGTAAQKWYLQGTADGYYILLPEINSKLALDVYGGNTKSGTNVWVYTRNNTDAQKWKIKAA